MPPTRAILGFIWLNFLSVRYEVHSVTCSSFRAHSCNRYHLVLDLTVPLTDLNKKRLNSNEHRSIILAKGGKYWIYEYLFAKKDRENIENDELLAFRLLAKSYAGLTAHQVGQLLKNGSFVEICHDDKTEIQE